MTQIHILPDGTELPWPLDLKLLGRLRRKPAVIVCVAN